MAVLATPMSEVSLGRLLFVFAPPPESLPEQYWKRLGQSIGRSGHSVERGPAARYTAPLPVVDHGLSFLGTLVGFLDWIGNRNWSSDDGNLEKPRWLAHMDQFNLASLARLASDHDH